jgi:hypothetical protein
MKSLALKNKYIYLSIALLAFIPLLSNIVKLAFNCLHATDFSIYQEAIYRIADFKSLNPYVYVRDLHIFSDHFDPVIFLTLPFVWLTNFSPYSLLVFEYLFFIGLLFFVFKLNKEKDPSVLVFALILVIFNRPILEGIGYPIHPTTWTILPGFLLFYFYQKSNDLGLILTAFAFCFFKEIFPASILGLSIFLLLKKRFKISLFLLSFSIAITYFNFVIRLHNF